MDSLMSQSSGLLPVDPSWFRHVNDFARSTEWLHVPVRAYAQYGVVLFALVLLWAWWTARGRDDVAAVSAALWAPAGTLLAAGLNQPIVNWVSEPRPYTTLPHVLVLVSRSSDYSFPSDHAVMAGAVAAGVFVVNRRLGLVTGLAAILMGLARVYVGAHYPGDVLVGLLFGAIVTLAAYSLVRRPLERLVAAMTRTPLRVLVTSDPAPGRGPDTAADR